MQKLIDKAGELRLLILASFRDDERPQLAIECPWNARSAHEEVWGT